MSSKNGKKPEKGEVPFGSVVWVLNNLSSQELEQLDEKPPLVEEVFSWLQRQIETGWKVSFKYDEKSKAVQVTCVQSRYEYPNAGYAFSSRSDDVWDALTICWFKYVKIADGVLGDFGVSSESVRG